MKQTESFLTRKCPMLGLLALATFLAPETFAAEAENSAKGGEATISFQATLPGTKEKEKEPKLIYSTSLFSRLQVEPYKATQTNEVAIKVIQGKLKEVSLRMEGQGDLLEVTGEGLLAWAVRRGTNDQRFLVLHPQDGRTNWAVTIKSVVTFTNLPFQFAPLSLVPEDPALSSGFIQIAAAPELAVAATNLSGLTPVEAEFFPGYSGPTNAAGKPLTFRFYGTPYQLSLRLAESDPDLRQVRFQDFKLTGQIEGDVASFTLTGTAVVKHPEGGRLEVLSGMVALTDFTEREGMELFLDQGRYLLRFERDGAFPVQLKFDARVREENGWKKIDFTPPPGTLRPVVLRGFLDNTKVEFPGATESQKANGEFTSHLPAAGALRLQWQEERPAEEGKLFFSVTGTSQISVSPGLARQTSVLAYKIMQGELQTLVLALEGEGEVTRVQGEGILTWRVEGEAGDRRLVVQLNQPQKDAYTLTVQTQMALDAFPLSFKPLRLIPENAIRYGGHVRVLNAGAVRLQVLSAPGLAQISPQQFPTSEILSETPPQTQAQIFAFRFSGPEFDLEIQADNVLPEISLSELLVYRLGETETTIEAELELEIREAPLREFEILVPADYSVASLNAPNLSDYNMGTADANGTARLRLQFGQPLSGRQLIQLRLTRSHAAPEETWTLVPLRPQKVKSVRGFVGMAAEPGLRLSELLTEGLTEIATAFFPRQLKDLQLAYRLREEDWTATVKSERLALSIQVDSLQLFSVGEGIIYGSTVLNYLIAGAPVGTFQFQVPTNYTNIEFIGRDVRNWKQTAEGYEVYLHAPVSGPYSLLITYDFQFNPRGAQISFNGIQPLAVQSEQGHVVLVSTYQFQSEPAQVSPGLIALEPGEIPTEYRLLFDAPILDAWQFTARPFQLNVRLTALAQGDTVNQVIDRASFHTHVSAEGQVLTDVTYLLKSKGHSHLRLTVPPNVTLWSARVNGEKVVPVIDQQATLIPLPRELGPNAVIPIELKLAEKSKEATEVRVALPQTAVPLLLADWQITPDEGYRLEFDGGTVLPVQTPGDASGFAWLAGMLRGDFGDGPRGMLLIGAVLFLIGTFLGRWATREGMLRFSARNSLGFGLGAVAIFLGFWAIASLVAFAAAHPLAHTTALAFNLPVQAPGSALSVSLQNEELGGFGSLWLKAWPVYFGLMAWGYFWITKSGWARQLGIVFGWTLVVWGCLRVPNGAAAFFGVLCLFAVLHVIVPLLRRQWQLPRPIRQPASGEAAAAGGAAMVLLLATALGGFEVGAEEVVGHRITGVATAMECSRAPVPLTPALSPREREPATQRGKAARSISSLSQRHILLPLPGGEGRGEGGGSMGISRANPLSFAAKIAGAALLAAPGFGQQRAKDTPVVVESVVQTARVQEQRVFFHAQMKWRAVEGQSLDFLQHPAVLKKIDYSTTDLRLVQQRAGGELVYRLTAQRSGEFEIAFDYELGLASKDGLPGFHLPTHQGLVNELTLQLDRADVEIVSPQVISARPAAANATGEIKTVFKLVLAPERNVWVAWKPRSRDTRSEKTVFYAELAQLFIPTAGIIEGVHEVQVRPAQGQVELLGFQTPEGLTITDVQAEAMANWKFDPDNRRLRVQFDPPHAKPFSIRLFSQITTGPLPFQKEAGLITAEEAAGQVGLVGVATGSDVQLEDLVTSGLSAINLEDFPAAVVNARASQVPGLALRRAFRAADVEAKLTLSAAAVQPDVRVESRQTLSLGEDRTVLAVNLEASITRAGVFQLSFVLPAGLDVEALSGQVLSHWTEIRNEGERTITMHLKGKTEGQHSFAINLAGPGAPAGPGWVVPRLSVREASKETGQLVVVPEQGMRLHIANRSGVTQLDPAAAGIRQKGVLAFRLLQSDWQLSFDVEKVDPWIQVMSLQNVTVHEGQAKVVATVDYEIENAGLKSFFIHLPADAEAVRFTGDQVADAVKAAQPAGDLVEWEVKLHRRIIGNYRLQASYQWPLTNQTGSATVHGVQVKQVNLQRAYLTLRTGGRLQVNIPRLPAALQPVDWRSIPASLRAGAAATEGNFTFRAVEPEFQLTLGVVRHDAARLLPARVERSELTSTLSSSGEVLTEVRMSLQPGDKRTLRLKLPATARFWFAFVNDAGVWPWQEGDQILIPLEQHSKPNQPAVIEFLYSLPPRSAKGRVGDFDLVAPEFDLPLENITWNVYLPPNRELDDWEGDLQLQEESSEPVPSRLDLQAYLQRESTARQEQTREAETMLQLGNQFLAEGQQQEAREAFRSAWSLSQHDDAFNEDARVQLHNLKMQQALVGLNYRRNAAFQEGMAGAAEPAAEETLKLLRGDQAPQYTQQQVKDALEKNTAEDNSALLRVAEQIIKQQDAAQVAPEAIRATLPEQGSRVTFTRSLLVDTGVPLRLELETDHVGERSLTTRFGMLSGCFLGLLLFGFAARGKHGQG